MAEHSSENPALHLSQADIALLPPDGGERYNRLIFSKSPYLLQHAENPVDWHPWGEEAFARARAEDRPVFVSIGYSTCHWCHVMAHESFEDDEVAQVLNRHFVAVKVDREERPDVDATYMATCQMMTGAGGWPLNLVLTPDKKPFFAATYLPKRTRQGMTGLVGILEKIAELWLTDRPRLLQTGEEVQRALLQAEQAGPEEYPEYPISEAPLRLAYQQLLESFDRRHAGFGRAPKFPMPHNLSLLLRLWNRTGEEKARAMAVQTLQAIRLGGIYDQIGFGVHRYAVDAGWLVPHFEKMLYDQALFVIAALESYQAGGGDLCRQSAEEVLAYVARDLSAPDGGFCCGEDADSEGAEGTFYLWTPGEVKEILGAEEGTVFCRSYGITEEGNFEGKSIPHLSMSIEELAQQAGVDPDSLAALLERSRQQLFTTRQQRVRPHRDDKVVAGWNGLMIAAFARGGAILAREDLRRTAAEAADFLLEHLRSADGRLLRRYRRGEAAVPAFLEDYAFLAWGMIELYLAGFETRHLATALELTAEMERLFGDGMGGYYETGSDAEIVLTRGRSLQDGALPSGTSVAAGNLLRLAALAGDGALEERGLQLLRRQLPQVERHPSAYAQFLSALDLALGPRSEVVLATADGDVAELLAVVNGRFRPHTVTLLHHPGDSDLEGVAPIAAGKDPLDGRPAAYVCRERTCLPPVTEPQELGLLLEEGRP